ncbi:MAG: haloacid dehalogenase-like hydrolase [Bdellovibrionales bacterium]|nr:haloacid dehalogenase-like hydrolase [Bdellovibrionales bacterium]MCB0414514.1 haloacid dehalogenase-like hydrolase [Bdellovibrionales bacterium]
MPLFDIEEVKKRVIRSVERGATPVAAFDADGTLWEIDMGEVFFEYQIENNLLPGLRKDAFAHYFSLFKTHSPQTAYLWLAQINKGVSPEQMLNWSRECAKKTEVPFISFQKELVDFFHEHQIEVFVVTASIRYAVAGAAEMLGIDFDHVLGVDVEVRENLLTDEQRGPITWKEGKMLALQNRLNGRKPVFCSGNTMGDLHLLEFSSDVRLVIAKASIDHKNYATEHELMSLAQERDWFFCE